MTCGDELHLCVNAQILIFWKETTLWCAPSATPVVTSSQSQKQSIVSDVPYNHPVQQVVLCILHANLRRLYITIGTAKELRRSSMLGFRLLPTLTAVLLFAKMHRRGLMPALPPPLVQKM